MKGEERGWILGRVSLHEIRGTVYSVHTAVYNCGSNVHKKTTQEWEEQIAT
jgi:hypothetical protein